ncbi:MAG: hypothetical protein ABSA68_09555 [Xanthobacteraceae bacterium]|jgi:hypothetical protein
MVEKSAIRFDDPIDVQIEIGKLLDQYRPQINKCADEILLRFCGSNLSRIAAAAYVKKLGSEIPDRAVRAAVKNLAIIEFARREIAWPCP